MACKRTHSNIQHFFVDFGQLLVITDGGQELVFQNYYKHKNLRRQCSRMEYRLFRQVHLSWMNFILSKIS